MIRLDGKLSLLWRLTRFLCLVLFESLMITSGAMTHDFAVTLLAWRWMLLVLYLCSVFNLKVDVSLTDIDTRAGEQLNVSPGLGLLDSCAHLEPSQTFGVCYNASFSEHPTGDRAGQVWGGVVR
ncbi:hypothetical protein GALMADRAFT_707083 [Galerina marginata CBS 339.88]|uniref:Uncharacterized protein n=1 Tax=Galerina marginata (strain CBS 339.88) TaxID=685588 RepID=A0A067TMA1_GALM3|nr:hypothetical protein GALMADRAFT_707083 [Galerina marginata CBS 339.88]